MKRIWLGMTWYAWGSGGPSSWEPAAVFPGDDADGLRAAVAWLSRPLEPGEISRSIRRWDIQGSGDTPGGQPGGAGVRG